MDKLMNGNKPPQCRMITDGDMSSECGIVRQHHLPTDPTIMSDMGVGHNKTFFTDLGDSAPKTRPPVDGHKLSYNGFPTDFHIGLFAFKFEGLRNRTHCCKLKNLAFRTDGYEWFDNGMGTDHRTGADGDIFTDNRIGTDLNTGIDICFGVNICSRVNHKFTPIDAMSSPSATTLSSTRAFPFIFATLPRTFSISTSTMI